MKLFQCPFHPRGWFNETTKCVYCVLEAKVFQSRVVELLEADAATVRPDKPEDALPRVVGGGE